MARAASLSHLRRLRRLSKGFLLAGVVALLLAAELTPVAAPPIVQVHDLAHGVGGGGGSGGVTNLSVNLTDAPAFAPRNLVGIAGGVLDFTLTNVGAIDHTFTVSAAAGVVIPRNDTPAQLDALLAKNGTLLNVSLAPGSSISVNYSVPVADAGDSFEIVSAVPYQFQAGMSGFLNISGGAAASSAALEDNTTDALRFLPDQLAVNATSFPVSLSVLVMNQGVDAHTWTLEGQSNNTLDPGTFTSYFQQNPPLANVNIPAGSGGAAWANFTITTPGAYEYICEVSGHFANGMFGWLYVGVPPPTVAAAPSLDIVQPAVLVAGGLLFAIGGLFAVVAALNARLPRAAPPAKDP